MLRGPTAVATLPHHQYPRQHGETLGAAPIVMVASKATGPPHQLTTAATKMPQTSRSPRQAEMPERVGMHGVHSPTNGQLLASRAQAPQFGVSHSNEGDQLDAEPEIGRLGAWFGRARWDLLFTYERAVNSLGGLTSGGDQILYAYPINSTPDVFQKQAHRLLCGFPDRTAVTKGPNFTVWTSTDRNGVFWMPEVPCLTSPAHDAAIQSLSPVAVVIKGHLRNSLSTSKLRDMLFELRRQLAPRPMHLFIETWDWTEAKKSWRSLDSKRSATRREQLQQYFAEFYVRTLNIHCESAVPAFLQGSTTGNVGGSQAPKFNWKHWIWLLWQGTQSVRASGVPYGAVIHTRFDWLEERVMKWMVRPDQEKWDAEAAVLALRACVAQAQPRSLAFLSCTGCDNLFVGGLEACAALSERLQKQLDEVIAVSPTMPHQEQYVLLAADEVSRSWMFGQAKIAEQGQTHILNEDDGRCSAVWTPSA
mmetsp:Transcript_49070/g.116781  ORF Transcript_49070/g.116781 Transcript_49070/m.116781 type:complete len:477 (+) Transcript_49070:114-1544(+)